MSDRNVRVVRDNGTKPVIKSIPKTASTLYDKNSLVEYASGKQNPVDDNDTMVNGIILQEVAAADSDYASASNKQMRLLTGREDVEIDTTAQLTVGKSYGLSNAYTVDSTDTTNDVFTCTEVISATRAIGHFKTYRGGNTSAA